MLNYFNRYTLKFLNSLMLMLVLLLFLASPAIAKQIEVGRVLMATQGVTAEQPGIKPRSLARRSAVFLGDTLKTPEGGRAQLRMADGEMISLMESSELFIEDFQYNSDEANNETDTNVKNLVTGGLRVITGAVKGKNYEMKSRAGTIGIRGTSFEAFTQQGENLYVRMLSGRVYVRNQQGGVEIGFNQPLSAIRITSPNSAPEAIQPRQLPEIFQRLFSKNTSLSSAGDQQQPRQEQQRALELLRQASQQEQQPNPAINQNESFAALLPPLVRPSFEPEPPPVEPPPVEPPPVEPPKITGSLGYLVGIDHRGPESSYTGQFMDKAVTINSSTDSYQATGESGTSVLGVANTVIDFDFNSYDLEKFTLGNSTVHLGNTGYLRDSNGLLLETASAVFSTNIHNTIDDLPGYNSYRYELISLNGPLKSGALDVNLSTGNMNVELLKKDRVGSFIGSGSISDFYNASINLVKENDGSQGEITGRFVGGNVEGAIATYKLDFSDADFMGVAVFDRTNTYPINHYFPESGFGYAFGKKSSQLYAGSFMNTPVIISEDGMSAIYGSGGDAVLGFGLVNGFDFYIDTNLHQLGYSDILIGFSEALNVPSSRLDINYPPESLDSSGFVFATNVHNTLSTLPSLNQDYTYGLLSAKGSAGATGGLDSGYLTVNFSTGAMGVSLLTPGNEYTGTGQVADFYNTAINLNSDTLGYTGSINGRFIGADAEGAITLYSLTSSAIDPITGVAIFDRTIVPPPPPNEGFGFVFGEITGQVYGGGFVGMPEITDPATSHVVINSAGTAVLGANVDLINNFDFFIGSRLLDLTYSSVLLGRVPFDSGAVLELNGQEALDGGFIFATNVQNTLANLPALGIQTYNLYKYYDGNLENGILNVNFGDGAMGVELDTLGNIEKYTGSGSINDFYNNTIDLTETSSSNVGSINGRFIGDNAEGAITIYNLNSTPGVAVFDRTGLNSPAP